MTINHSNNDDGDDVGGGDHNGKYMAACKVFSPIYDVGDDDNGGVVGVGLGDHNDEKLQENQKDQKSPHSGVGDVKILLSINFKLTPKPNWAGEVTELFLIP